MSFFKKLLDGLFGDRAPEPTVPVDARDTGPPAQPPGDGERLASPVPDPTSVQAPTAPLPAPQPFRIEVAPAQPPVDVIMFERDEAEPRPSRKPPAFSALWMIQPPLVTPEPRWLRTLSDAVGVVLDDGLRWPSAPTKVREPTFTEFDDKNYMSWSDGQSPVKKQTATFEEFAGSPSELATALRKVLSMPGEPADFHFVIQGAVVRAFEHRHHDPFALQWVEWLCWLNIRFIEAVPSAVRFSSTNGDNYARVVAFGTLAGLYEDEGMLTEASLVAQRASRFRNLVGGDKLRDRIAALESEDAADAPD